MTVGLGLSIGSVNSAAAVAAGSATPTVVAERRTTVRFDGDGMASVGTVPRTAAVLADFADLMAVRDPLAIVDGRAVTGADLVAVVANRLIEDAAASGDTVLAHPAVYHNDQVSALRQALDRAGLTAVRLVPEPLAAAAWMAPQDSTEEFVLVCDLGASSLDVAVVHRDTRDTRLLGRPVRSYDFGGRPFETALARYSHDLAPDVAPPRAGVVSEADLVELCARHIGESLPLVLDCVRGADISIDDIGRVLLLGGAAHSAPVARVFADELGLPVVLGPEPGHTIALGAAVLAAATPVPNDDRVIVAVGSRGRGVALTVSAVAGTGLVLPGLLLADRIGSAPESSLHRTDTAAPYYDPYLAVPGVATGQGRSSVEPGGVVLARTDRPGGAHGIAAFVMTPREVQPDVGSEQMPEPSATQLLETPSLASTSGDDAVVTVGTTDFPDAAASVRSGPIDEASPPPKTGDCGNTETVPTDLAASSNTSAQQGNSTDNSARSDAAGSSPGEAASMDAVSAGAAADTASSADSGATGSAGTDSGGTGSGGTDSGGTGSGGTDSGGTGSGGTGSGGTGSGGTGSGGTGSGGTGSGGTDSGQSVPNSAGQ
ncbi:Hsp70 family protein [Nocardia sp. NPDC050710]|uniref:Hsp70 family protein n=1 Tax=Nocardia sp. NPDC050710 TaxID=3157220 RepID=UPI00340546A9